jgi:hypothetical protein
LKPLLPGISLVVVQVEGVLMHCRRCRPLLYSAPPAGCNCQNRYRSAGNGGAGLILYVSDCGARPLRNYLRTYGVPRVRPADLPLRSAVIRK